MGNHLRLGDHCIKIGSGATPRGGKDSYLPIGPFSLIRSQNVYNEGFSRSGLAFISQEQADALRNAEVKSGDVLLNITGDSVARACQVAKDVLPARVNQHVAIIRPKPDKIDPQFLRYFLVSREMQEGMLALASAGATRPALTKGMIENFQIPALKITEQRAIAAVLSALDDKIELNRRMNATLEGLARALFRDWFVDFGPTRAKMALSAKGAKNAQTKPYLAPEIWSLFPDSLNDEGIPEGWEVTKAGEVLNRLRCNRRYKKKDAQTNGVVPIFEQGADILLGYHNDKAEFLASPERPMFVFGDHTCITKLSCRPFSISQNVIPLEGKKHPSIWVYYAIERLQSFQEYKRHWSDLIEKTVFEPSLELSEIFSGFVSPILLKKEENEIESHTLAQTRDLLLPKLMSGEIRVGEVEKAVEDAG